MGDVPPVYPEPEWALPRDVAKPWLVDIEDGNLGVQWAYGPQGHPASMRVSVELFAESGWEPRIWVSGPKRGSLDLPFDAGTLAAFLLYGQRVEAEFGDDWRWHQCAPGCYGTVKSAEPPYVRCPDCQAVRGHEESRTAAWVAANPLPTPITRDQED